MSLLNLKRHPGATLQRRRPICFPVASQTFITPIMLVAMAFGTWCGPTVFADDETADIEVLAKDLASGDLEKRREAVYAIAALGSKAQPALKALIKILDDERDDQVWFQAATAVARIGPSAEEAIPVLIEHLGEREDQRRYRASFALGKIGSTAVDPLRKALKSESSDARAAAAKALNWIGPASVAATDELVAALSDSDPTVQENAGNALATIGIDCQEKLVAELNDSPTKQSAAVISVLGRIGNLNADVVSLIKSKQQSKNDKVRTAAVEALFRAKLPMNESIALLDFALKDSSQDVRRVGLGQLRLQDDLIEFRPVLQRLLESDNPTEARTAAQAIGLLGEAGAETVPRLIELLVKRPDDGNIIVQAITRIGPAAIPHLLSVKSNKATDAFVERALTGMGSSAMETLVAATKNDDPGVRLKAIRSLGQMDSLSDSAFQAIVEQLNHSDEKIQAAAAESIGHAKKQLQSNTDAIAALAKAAKESPAEVRKAAIVAMSTVDRKDTRQSLMEVVESALGNRNAVVREGGMIAITNATSIAPSFVHQIVAGLQDESKDVRISAANAIRGMDKNDLKDTELIENISNGLNEGLTDSSDDVKAAVAMAIAKTKAIGPETIERLSDMLSNSNAGVVRPAVDALATIGNDASSAVPAFLKLYEHPDSEVRASIATALPRIEKDANKIVAPLIKLLDDGEWVVRREACQALGDIGPDAKSAISKLFSMLDNEDDRDAARSAIKSIDDADADAVPVLIEGLKSDERRKTYYAVFLLTKIGPAAKDALPHLEKAKSESDSGRFTTMIEKAIKAIED